MAVGQEEVGAFPMRVTDQVGLGPGIERAEVPITLPITQGHLIKTLYGIGPASTDSDTINYGAHSDVERLLESELYRFVEFTWRATFAVAARK